MDSRPAPSGASGNDAERLVRILIVGAGIGGLTAALALARDGHEVAVYEQAPQLAEIGAGVQISANGARVLFALGLEDPIRAVWSVPSAKEIRLWNTGETWKLFDLGSQSVARYGAPYFMIHRADLHQVLIDAVRARKPDALALNARVTGFEHDGRRVTLNLANGERVAGDVLIGADGVHSRVRNILVGDDRPVFTGCMAWRGLVPVEKLPAHMRRNVGVNWVGPGGHVINYLLRRAEIFNFVGIVERDWRVESWTERGTREECAADFSGWNADIHAIIRNIAEPYKWALLGREPLARLAYGRVALLGDAAHPTLPMLAQGANMAIEDGMVLARCLAAYDDVAMALARYDGARVERTAKLVRGANEMARRFHNPALADANGAKAYVDAQWNEETVKQRYDWIFQYDATSVVI
jgi:salicylate hydroxylase